MGTNTTLAIIHPHTALHCPLLMCRLNDRDYDQLLTTQYLTLNNVNMRHQSALHVRQTAIYRFLQAVAARALHLLLRKICLPSRPLTSYAYRQNSSRLNSSWAEREFLICGQGAIMDTPKRGDFYFFIGEQLD